MTVPRPPIEFGVGLWGMRSTALAPASWRALYRGLREDAQLAEELGFDSLWLAEHHGWYDGWCPQLWVAAASALGATERIRIGTAMYLLPQHEVAQTVRDLDTLGSCFGERVEVGVGLGYRDEEFDAVGLARAQRGRRMDAALERLVQRARTGSGPAQRLWVGGFSEAAFRRAGRFGSSLLLPDTVRPSQITAAREQLADECGRAGHEVGRIGAMVDVWPCDPADADPARERIVRFQREYAGVFFTADDEPLFAHPELLDKQSERIRRAIVTGPPEVISERLNDLHAAGVDTFVLNVRFDFPPAEHRRAMTVLAESVVPAVRAASDAARVPA